MRVSRSGGGGSSGDTDNSKGQKHKHLAPVYTPKTANQKIYCGCLNDPNASIVLGVGPAGTGKTLFACITAIQLLRAGEIHKIVLTRPVVAVEEEELGFLPGNMVMKMDPWTRPIFDVFLEYYAQKDVDAMVQSGVIEISPLAYMRGRTFKRSFIIADEMQNSSPNQMLMLITRIGEKSKMVITGDLKQSDRVGQNGLHDLLNKMYRHNGTMANAQDRDKGMVSVGGIRAVELMAKDVERSAIVKQVLALYETPNKPEASNKPESSNSTLTAGKNTNNTTKTNTTTIPGTEKNVSSKGFAENDDAALIPVYHSSKYYQGENYWQYSSDKWSGW
jgi:phosphate starvation-inducible PhoH-like protein